MIQKLPKILVIDDEPATLTMFHLFLSAFGYEVLVAGDGRSGLNLVKEHHPDIVFTDIKMPVMDGFEVLRQVKKIAPRTEVIVITGHGDMDLVVRALNMEATDFINKPIRRTALEAALDRAGDRLRRSPSAEASVLFDAKGKVARIRVEGALGMQQRKAFQESCQRARETTPGAVLVEFTASATVNGPGIAELISGIAAIRDNGQRVAVLVPSENLRVIFEMVGVARYAALYEQEETALAALRGGNA